MGFDDIYISKYLNPKLTAVRQDAYEMGRQAAGMLIRYIDQGMPLTDRILPYEIMERGTLYNMKTFNIYLKEDIHMKYRNVGKAGIKVSEIALGSWMTDLKESSEEDVAKEVVKLAYENGINFFDCADAYSEEQLKGSSERC